MSRTEWWLVGRDGTRRRVDSGGLLLGRSPRCDLVLRDPRASRSQALVYFDGDRGRLVVLGKGRTLLNGVAAERDVELTAGDRISLPGLELEVATSSDGVPPRDGQGWVLDRPGGGLFGVSHNRFVIGGHAGADLQLADWPHHALTLHLTQGRLHLAAHVPLEVDGVTIDEDGLVALSPGSRIVYAGQTLQVVAGGDFGHGSTLFTEQCASAALPEQLELEFLPRGGRLRVRATSGEYCVYLPGRRCDLMALLLRPPEPHRLGDLLDDDLLISRLWPNQSRTRADLNTLIYRLRGDLVRAGIDATSLLVRAQGGGATRLAVAQDVAVDVA